MTENDHVEFSWLPPADDNILVMAFSGWSDAGASATTAVEQLEEHLGARKFADIDPDHFYDFQVTRPKVRVEDGMIEEIDWPSNSFSYADRREGAGGVILASCHEPNVHWKSYVGAITEIITRTQTKRVLTLGSLLADVPHTRPANVICTASSTALRDSIGLRGADYQGPTGIVGVLHDTLRRRGFEAVSLWASVPHYVSVTPNPKGVIALLEALEPAVGVTMDLSDLRDESMAFEEQVDEAMEDNPEVQAYVELLEGRADREEDAPLVEGKIPSGDEIAKELQEFLRSEDD